METINPMSVRDVFKCHDLIICQQIDATTDLFLELMLYLIPIFGVLILVLLVITKIKEYRNKT